MQTHSKTGYSGPFENTSLFRREQAGKGQGQSSESYDDHSWRLVNENRKYKIIFFQRYCWHSLNDSPAKH